MSYFEDQYEEWMENDCQGNLEDYGDGLSYVEEKKPYTPPPNKVRTSAYGRSRSLLSMSKLEEFAEWAVKDGFTREPTKGEYEVLRLRWPNMQPFIYFRREGAQHATSQAEGTQLVARWLKGVNK
jgi:hypothetical protein